MELLRQVTGIIIIVVICKFLYDLASVIGARARFYERFLQLCAKYRGQKDK